MKTRNLFSPKASLALQLAVVPISVFSAYFFLRLDRVVHGDLYRYGLQFNNEWATQYWTYSRLIVGFLGVALIVTGISIAFIFIHMQTHSSSSKAISWILIVVGTMLTSSCVFFFNRLDYVVNHDLYRYGLEFSTEWAVPYWAYARLTLGSLGLATIATVISASMILGNTSRREVQFLPRTHLPSKIGKTKLICSILSSAGVVTLVLSIFYSSSILAFIGLGLVFWGVLLLYLTPIKHVKLELLNAIALSPMINIEKMIADMHLGSKAIYLPPKYLKDFESSLAFIPSKTEQALPKPEEVDEEKLYSKNPNGLFLTPPGLTLSKLFEKELGRSLIKTDIAYLQEKLPKLLIEDLEIMENVDLLPQGKTVTIEIKNHIFKDICEETRKYQRLHESIGCPLCSAFACALAKATGRPITIEKEEQTQDGKMTRIQYLVLEE